MVTVMNKDTLKLTLFSFIKATLLALLVISFTGCVPPASQQVADDPDVPVQPEFTWATDAGVPRWRSLSPIRWLRTDESEEAINQSRTTGKPILCYISRYDSDLTGTVEDGLLSADTWGESISENFIAWEVDWWRDPEFAQGLLGNMQPPALFVLIPDPNGTSDELGIVDFWVGTELLKFPLHDSILPLENPAAHERISAFATTGWDELLSIDLERWDINPDEFTGEYMYDLACRLTDYEDLFPVECLTALYKYQNNDAIMAEIANRITAWSSYFNAQWFELFPDERFVIGSGWSIDLTKITNAVICAEYSGSDWPVQDRVYLNWLKLLIYSPSETGGGFPTYVDMRNTFDDTLPYLDDESEFPLDWSGTAGIPGGPRDVVWVNARMLGRITRLLNAYPSTAEILPDTTIPAITFGEFMDKWTPLMIDAMLETAGAPESMSLPDKAYLLDLLNQYYQRTSEIRLLELAGEIAATFPPENPDQWFDPWQAPFLPDLAVALHHYGWLAESESAREAAVYIAEEGIPYAPGFGTEVEARFAYAYDVVNSKCLHVGVLSTPDDALGLTLLTRSLTGWDPRKIAQILYPERDADLLELKGYVDMGRTAAMICVDDMCFMPAFDTESLDETLQEALGDFYAAED